MPDSTLAALFPAIPVTVGGERVQLRPVTLGELPVVERLMEAWCAMVATAGLEVDPENWDAFVDLLASAVARTRAWVEALPSSEFERLASLALAINEDVWNPAATGGAESEAMTWSAIVQRLVEHGHPFEALKGFTLGQCRAFLLEALRRERADLAQGIQAAAFSMVDGKTTQKVLRELSRE